MSFMNYLVFLDPYAGELEKILSGIKCMVLKEIDPVLPTVHLVSPVDSLYFLRGKDDRDLRVSATVIRVTPFINSLEEDLSHTLKELQPRLQLTEDQYNYWSIKEQVQLVEFDCAHKIEVIQVASNKITDRSDWIAFKEFSEIT
jgi:hypothetical protein